jgi:ribosomal protein L11 methyltransferase
VGSGSGILGIAAIRLGAASVTALDTDPIAVEATHANARRNRAASKIEPRLGSLPSGESPFRIVLANLIAGVLIELAPAIAAELAPGGALIASGIFVDRATAVRSALEEAGLRGERHWTDGDWVALEARASGR